VRSSTASFAIAVTLAASVIGACGRSERTPARGLHPLSPPDVSKMSEAVRTQVRGRYASLTSKLQSSATPAGELANAYGEVGELLLAARYLETAEPALLNARALAPDDPRWPYYLAQLYRIRGALEQAAASFRDALALKPDDTPTRVWLARVYIDQSRYDDAEPLLAWVLQRDPQSTAALYQSGRLALGRRDFRQAASQLEAGLRHDPAAAPLHYPLAMAYRGLGRNTDAEAQLRMRDQRNMDIAPADPLMDKLAALLDGPQAYEVRGTEALNRGDWPKAAEEFRKGIEVAPANPLVRHRLATALFMMGNASEAERQFQAVLEASPEYSPAHYSLAVLHESRGDDPGALERYAAAVKYQPTYTQARLRLGRVLRRSGRPAEALSQYEEVMRIDPRIHGAALETAITLVRLRRYEEARDRLIAGMQSYPQEPAFPRALARLLAAAPDDAVRDGGRAITLTEELLKRDHSTDVGETMAMALAADGQYGEAARIQRELIAASRAEGRNDLVERMTTNLKLYERRMPCRIPWRDEDVGDVTAPPDAIRAALPTR
jgi:tetratricopeptide (TPR) repeat protein